MKRKMQRKNLISKKERKKEETFRRCLASEDLLSSLATIELKIPIVKQSSLASIRSSIVSIDTVKAF